MRNALLRPPSFKGFARTLISAILLCLFSCAAPDSEQTALNLVLKASPNKLDPALVVDVAEGEICTQVFQGLVKFSPGGAVSPSLAKSWEVKSGGKRYVFHLDDRMKFSNGRRVEAADVRFSFERILGPASASPRKWVLGRLEGADAFAAGTTKSISGLTTPDDSTVVLELTSPFKPFLSMLALPAAMVVPGEALAGADDTGSGRKSGEFRLFRDLPVGSGPWRIETWERGDYLALSRNPFYPEKPAGVHTIRYRVIPEAFTRIAEFESGSLDILEVPQAELKRFLNDRRYDNRIQSRSELRVFYIGLNNTKLPFKDVRVRRALNMSVDVDKLIETLANGQGTRAGGAIPPGLPGYVDRRRYPYDLETARSLLADAGYPDGFSMEIWQRESPEGTRMLEAVQGYLLRAGIEVKLVRREWSAFKEAVSNGRVDAFYLDWFADYPDAENFIYPLFHSQNVGGGGNRSFFADAGIDSLIEIASCTVDQTKCNDMYGRIDSLVYDRAPWIYMYFPETFYVLSDGLSGYVLPTLYLGNDFMSVRKNRN